MEWLRRALFESPLKLYLLLAVAEMAIAACWYSRRSRRWALALLGPPVLGGIVALTAHLVVTDRERIVAALKDIAASAEAGDLTAAAGDLDPTCVGVDRSGDAIPAPALIALGQRALRTYPVQRVRLRNMVTDIAGANATTRLSTEVTFRTGERFRLNWKVQWAKRPAGWRITAVDLPAVVSAI
jgi:hypothetical protein